MISAALAMGGFALWAVVDARASAEGGASSLSPAWGLPPVAAAGGWLLGAGSLLSVIFWMFVSGGIAAAAMSVGVGFWWWVTAPTEESKPPIALMGLGAILILIQTIWALATFVRLS